MFTAKHKFATATSLVIASAVLYCSWPLGYWLNPAASRAGLASELGAFGQPYNWLFIWADIVSGFVLLIGCMLLLRLWHPGKWARRTLVLLAIYGVCGALDAILPESCLPSMEKCGPVIHDPLLIMHGAFDLLGEVALLATLFTASLFVHRHNKQWRPWIYVIGVAGTLFAVASAVLYIFGGPSYWAQRYYLTISCIWVASIPFVLQLKRAKL